LELSNQLIFSTGQRRRGAWRDFSKNMEKGKV